MPEDLLDEISSINSIYGEYTLITAPERHGIYILTFPSQPDISLRLEFPTDYPDAPPSILSTQHIGDNVVKGDGQDFVEAVRLLLAELYTPGSPCIFDLIEEAGQRLEHLGTDDTSEQDSQIVGTSHPDDLSEDPALNDHQPVNSSSDNPHPIWTLSAPLTEKKSIFLARCTPVTSKLSAQTALTHLLTTDKRAAKATHNITAWRIRSEDNPDVKLQDCDDDGESAAGSRLLHLLELMGAWNVLVVVSRWYGGVKLGPDRFRLINQVAREAVVEGGFVSVAADGKGKAKRKKK